MTILYFMYILLQKKIKNCSFANIEPVRWSTKSFYAKLLLMNNLMLMILDAESKYPNPQTGVSLPDYGDLFSVAKLGHHSQPKS